MNKEIKKPEKIFIGGGICPSERKKAIILNRLHTRWEAYHKAECEKIETFHNELRQIHVNKVKAEMKRVLEGLLKHLEDLTVSGDIQINSNMSWYGLIEQHKAIKELEREGE